MHNQAVTIRHFDKLSLVQAKLMVNFKMMPCVQLCR